MIRAVIFDLDGVIVSTDEFHFQAWMQLAKRLHIPFNREINERLRGVSRYESLNIILENATNAFSEEEKQEFLDEKNNTYIELLHELSDADILPGVTKTLEELKERDIRIAIGSSSRNTPRILKYIGMEDTFDAVADGNDITKSKPDPEVFLLAAQRLNIKPSECLVVEDAYAGIEAAKAAGMKALAVGSAYDCPDADVRARDLSEVSLVELLN
ncbi:beta-phosphoglucomutase [Vallitaleaceae bacterium 9-2]